MDVIKLLMSTWPTKTKKKIKRTTKLIIPVENLNPEKRNINHTDWEFIVPYGFREAVDIKYEKRMKDKNPYYVWTQGPILSFKEGDLLHHRSGKNAVQVQFACSMGWDPDKDEMYLGSVVFDSFEINDQKYKKTNRTQCTQMDFLQLLIHGENRIK